MDIFKKTALCILVSSSLLIACGGSDDSPTNTQNNESNNNGNTSTEIPNASLTNSESLAKAVAAIIVSRKMNEILYYNASATIDAKPQGDSICASGGKLNVTYDTSPPVNQRDGTVVFSECNVTSTLTDLGKLVFQCQENCDNSLGISSNLTRSQLISGGVKSVLNGSWLFENGKEVFKGELLLTKDGLSTLFSFGNGLISDFLSDTPKTKIMGKLGVRDGSILNCINGSFDYKSTSSLMVDSLNKTPTSGVVELSVSGVAVGTVSFNGDGSIKTKLNTETIGTNVTKDAFESYCALSQIRALDYKK